MPSGFCRLRRCLAGRLLRSWWRHGDGGCGETICLLGLFGSLPARLFVGLLLFPPQREHRCTASTRRTSRTSAWWSNWFASSPEASFPFLARTHLKHSLCIGHLPSLQMPITVQLVVLRLDVKELEPFTSVIETIKGRMKEAVKGEGT